MSASVSGAVLGWLVLIQIWILVLWYRPRNNSFARRLDQLLAVLLAEPEVIERRPGSAVGEGTFGRLMGSSRLGRVKSAARRWRTQLRADLTSLERLLAQIGVSQPALRSRFDSQFRLVPTPHQTREFRELAGASFVLGGAARILEAVTAADGTVPPPGLLATLRTHLR